MHQGVSSPEVLAELDVHVVCKIQTGTLAHAHERVWCGRLMKENVADPGDSYAVSRPFEAGTRPSHKETKSSTDAAALTERPIAFQFQGVSVH